ncbi:sac3 ganp family protein [Diplodia corticola]|uniref:Sac3 ganp family protein n=1 Tax=Diplodia corticola TaxID=236234 RepID=A0A1J9S087_9PEZI|nr:sac3 ganp family protein [Diplodia corticola]OJD33436.1 sac3 ganp family protein [Diplodia corticola]
MAPMSLIDDSDENVVFSRGGFTTRRPDVTADSCNGRHELNNGQKSEAAVGYVVDTEDHSTYRPSRPQVGPPSFIDDSSEVGVRNADRKSLSRHKDTKTQFENPDPGAEQAYKSLVKKVQNARKNGFVEFEDGKWRYDLQFVRDGKTTSLLSNAVSSSSAKNASLPSGNPKQAEIPQKRTVPASQDTPAAHRIELRGNQKASIANHVGGIPFPTVPRKPKVIVAHELTDEERISKPTAFVVSPNHCGQKEDIPRFGFLIPGANGKIRLVNNSNGSVLTYRGAEARPSRAVDVTATPVAQSPGPISRANYQAPTVESVSDSGDLGGLFD